MSCTVLRSGGAAVAAVTEGNMLAEPDPGAWVQRALRAAAAVPVGRVVAWSGTLAEEGLFARDPRNWLRPGHEALAKFCSAVEGALRDGGIRLALRPHSRHVLSDPASCLRFLDERGEGPFDLALAPAALLEPSMLDEAEDHLERAFATLAGRAAIILLHDVAPKGDGLAAVRLGDGVLPRDALARLVAAHVPPQTPVVMLE